MRLTSCRGHCVLCCHKSGPRIICTQLAPHHSSPTSPLTSSQHPNNTPPNLSSPELVHVRQGEDLVRLMQTIWDSWGQCGTAEGNEVKEDNKYCGWLSLMTKMIKCCGQCEIAQDNVRLRRTMWDWWERSKIDEKQFDTLEDNMRLMRTMWDWWGLCETDEDNVRLMKTLWDWLGLCETDEGNVIMMRTVWDWWGQCETDEDYVRLMKTMWDWWGLCETGEDYVRMTKTMRDWWELCETDENYVRLMRLMMKTMWDWRRKCENVADNMRLKAYYCMFFLWALEYHQATE
jgi:hypothetical protein